MTLEQLIEAGRYDEACAMLEPRSAAGDPSASSNIAIFSRRQGNPNKELFYAQKAYGQAPRSSTTINTLMRAYRGSGLVRAVADLYRACGDVRGLDRIHHLWGAEALIAINRLTMAEEALARAPEFPLETEHELRLALARAAAEQDYDAGFEIMGRLEP